MPEGIGRRFLSQVPGYRQLMSAFSLRSRREEGNTFPEAFPPGHFYSPLPDPHAVARDKAILFDRAITAVPGIDVRANDQLSLVSQFAEFYHDLPFEREPRDGVRYYYDNSWFPYGDAIILYSMLRRYRPRKVIEVGSGFSSAVMLDTNDRFLSKQIVLTFVEPYPDRLLSLLSDEDRARHDIVKDVVQNIPVGRFAALDEGDILFVDSSHVAKIGSDVVHLFTNVLPALKRGVIVHFHDVFWPFEYPEEWIRSGNAWNEAYFLKAFLQFNSAFKILFFNSYMGFHHRGAMEESLPLFLTNPGGSIWIEKVA